MKKKIVFMVINMNVGGTEKALLNMISDMPKDKYDITILMLEKQGGFVNSIPCGIRVEYLKEYDKLKEILNKPPKEVAIKLLKKGNFTKSLKLILYYLLFKITKNKIFFLKYILKKVPNYTNEYDVAVAYAGPMDFISYFVAQKIKAKTKIQWIHFDIEKIGFDKVFGSKIYNTFDKVFVVSKEGKNKLLNILPKIKGKTDIFSNIISKQLVLKIADKGEGFKDEFVGTRILTVGRLSKEKGQDLIIPVLAKLKESGFHVRWYCIGEGSARREYEELIKEYDVESEFILLGSKSNPYPYMKQCDIYVQPSRHEGYCITLSEARCFTNPIISTNFTGANEQILNEHTGLIVDFDQVEMYNALTQLLTNNELRNRIKDNLTREIVDTTKETEKLYKILDEL